MKTIKGIDEKIAKHSNYYDKRKYEYHRKEFLQIEQIKQLLAEIGVRKMLDEDFIKIKYSYKFEPWGRASETWEDEWEIELTQLKFYYDDLRDS